MKRKATGPILAYLKRVLFDNVIQNLCQQSDMEWAWIGVDVGEDMATKVNRLIAEIQNALLTVNEARMQLGRRPYEGSEVAQEANDYRDG